jgi:hypothetical protein
MNNSAKSNDSIDEEVGDEEERTTDTTKDLILNTLGIVEPGLVVVTVPSAAMTSQVRVAIERQIRSGGQKIGLRFPKKTPMKSLYSGNGRRVLEAKALATGQTPIDGAAAHEFESIGTREGFTLTSDEGLCSVLPLVEKTKGGWLTFAQSADAFSALAIVEALMRLRFAAKKAGSYVLLILVTDRKLEDLRIYDYCDDLLIAAPCISDTGAQFAFSVDVFGLRDLNEMGIGKTMCSVRMRNSQRIWKWEPFIAADVLKRVIWKLRCSGKSLTDIGKIVDCDKSTVHRHLVGLPPVVKREFKEGWLKPYADLIEIAIESDENSEPEEDL